MQRLISRRLVKKSGAPDHKNAKGPVTSKDLAKEYERHTQRQRTLVRRAALVNERLTILSESLKRLLQDEAFVGLLRAEALDTIPEQLATRFV